ncbi:hypothetical protein JCM8547_002733 [Rhodosporidiobolus lusitaniae]
MSSDYSHRAPSVEPDRPRTGEWDTPLAHRPSSSSRPHDRSTRQDRTPRDARALTVASDAKPVYSALKQQVLSEDDYLAALSRIIKRDFFPHLADLDKRNSVLSDLESDDPLRVEEGIRRMRELGRTPRAASSSRRDRKDPTPGRTPYSTLAGDATPTYFDRTPTSTFSATPSYSPLPSSSRSHHPSQPADPTEGLSLDSFQAKYTSEDNSSFATLLARDNAERRTKHSWAFDAEVKANRKALKGRSARERLVEITRRMVDEGGGTVRMVDGGAGRPAERKLLVSEGVELGGEGGGKGGERLMIKGRDKAERLLLTAGGEGKDEKGKGKEVAVLRVDEKAKQFVDWDHTTVEEDEANKEVDKGELQVETQAWPFKNRNSLMFPPDADRYAPSSLPSSFITTTSSSSSSSSHTPLAIGERKGIRHAATRLMELEKPSRGGGGGGRSSASEAGSEWTLESGSGPSRSRIGMAVAGTPYPNPSSSSSSSSTPRVSGFSFVDALPDTSSSSLPPQALQELMTWGTIEATPVTLRSSSYSDFEGGGGAVGPFRIREPDRKEQLAMRMAKKAKRSLAASAGVGSSTGLALDARPASVRGTPSSFTPRAGSSAMLPPGASPRPSASSLTPAGRSLLSRTKPGRALELGLGKERGWTEEEERRRVERARVRAREVEGRERLRRERWTPSPAVSLGFDPDLEPPRRTPPRLLK